MSDDEAPPADPEDLDFTDDENVVEIGEGRYVVGTDGRPNLDGSGSGPAAADASDRAERAGQGGAADPSDPSGASASGRGAGEPVDKAAVNRWLTGSFDNDGFEYGVDLTVSAEGQTARNRMVSNDVTATFDTLLSWFLANAGPESSPSEALGLLLVAADTSVELPPEAITQFAADQGLSADDSIGDLVRAAETAGGFRIE
jgi:hypothetical protein